MAPALARQRRDPEIRVSETPGLASRAAAESFCALAEAAVRERGRFMVSLTGGSSPAGVISLLASPGYRDRVRWDVVHLFWGDERSVPPDHPRSNYRLAERAMIRYLPVPPANVHRIEGELMPEDAASRYSELLDRAFGGEPRFDLIHLGMGDDGHVCSLFPFHPLLHERQRRTGVALMRELGEWRVTLTQRVLRSARRVEFLVFGAAKRGRVAEVLQGALDPIRLPAQGVRPVDGQTVWWLDRGAAGALRR